MRCCFALICACAPFVVSASEPSWQLAVDPFDLSFLPPVLNEFLTNTTFPVPTTELEISAPLALASVLLMIILWSVPPSDQVGLSVKSYFDSKSPENGDGVDDDNFYHNTSNEDSGMLAGSLFVFVGVILVAILTLLSFPGQYAALHNSIRSVDLVVKNANLEARESPILVMQKDISLTCTGIALLNATKPLNLLLEGPPLIYLGKMCEQNSTIQGIECPADKFCSLPPIDLCVNNSATRTEFTCTIPLSRSPGIYWRAGTMQESTPTYSTSLVQGAVYLVLGILMVRKAKTLADSRTTHYMFGVIAAVVLAVAVVIFFFFKQMRYVHRTMGGGGAMGDMAFGGWFNPARYAEQFVMLFLCMFPSTAFNLYGTFVSQLKGILYTRILTIEGDSPYEGFGFPIYQPLKTFLAVAAFCGCLFIYVSGWFSKPGSQRTLLRIAIISCGLYLGSFATSDLELSLLLLLLVEFIINGGCIRVIEFVHWVMHLPAVMVGSLAGPPPLSDEDDEDAEELPDEIRRHKGSQLTREEYEYQATFATQEALNKLSNAMKNDSNAQDQMRRCRKIGNGNLNDFKNNRRNHLLELKEGASSFSLVSILTNLLMFAALVVVVYCGATFAVQMGWIADWTGADSN